MHRRQFITSAAIGCTAGCSQLDSTSENQYTESDPKMSVGPSTQISGGPVERKIGIEYRRSDSTKIRVDSVRLARTVTFETGDVIRSSDGKALLLVEVNATNPTDSIKRFPDGDAFTLLTGEDQYKPIDIDSMTVPEPRIEFPRVKPVYSAVENAHPGLSSTGITVFEVPIRTTEVRVMLAGKSTNEPVAYWDGSVDPRNLPRLEVQSIDAPAEHVNGDPVEVSVSVKNIGGSPGLFNRSLSVISDKLSTRQTHKLYSAVRPGETVTFDRTIPARSAQNLTIAIPPDTRRTISIIPAKRPFDTPYTLSNGVRVKVGPPIITDTVTIDKGAGKYQDGTRDSVDFATIEITAWNPTRSEQTQPDEAWFEIEANGFVDSDSNRGFYKGLLQPIQREYYPGWGESTLPPDGSIGGVLYYDIPKGTDIGDVLCRGRFPGQGSAKEVCIWGSE